jgi:hypothetical protein
MKDMSLKQQNNDTIEKDIQISDKPVAWMRRLDDRIIRLTPEPVWDTDEPLYTAPRELSDDEIITRYRELMARNSV